MIIPTSHQIRLILETFYPIHGIRQILWIPHWIHIYISDFLSYSSIPSDFFWFNLIFFRHHSVFFPFAFFLFVLRTDSFDFSYHLFLFPNALSLFSLRIELILLRPQFSLSVTDPWRGFPVIEFP
jgi:hypothetical protein